MRLVNSVPIFSQGTRKDCERESSTFRFFFGAFLSDGTPQEFPRLFYWQEGKGKCDCLPSLFYARPVANGSSSSVKDRRGSHFHLFSGRQTRGVSVSFLPSASLDQYNCTEEEAEGRLTTSVLLIRPTLRVKSSEETTCHGGMK